MRTLIMKKILAQIFCIIFLFTCTLSSVAYSEHKNGQVSYKSKHYKAQNTKAAKKDFKVAKKDFSNNTKIKAHLVIDVDTGKVLHAENEHTRLYPASLTKMMTIYMIFDGVRKHKIRFDDYATTSAYAATMQPSKLGLNPGDKITYRDIVSALIVKSCLKCSKFQAVFSRHFRPIEPRLRLLA